MGMNLYRVCAEIDGIKHVWCGSNWQPLSQTLGDILDAREAGTVVHRIMIHNRQLDEEDRILPYPELVI